MQYIILHILHLTYIQNIIRRKYTCNECQTSLGKKSVRCKPFCQSSLFYQIFIFPVFLNQNTKHITQTSIHYGKTGFCNISISFYLQTLYLFIISNNLFYKLLKFLSVQNETLVNATLEIKQLINSIIQKLLSGTLGNLYTNRM